MTEETRTVEPPADATATTQIADAFNGGGPAETSADETTPETTVDARPPIELVPDATAMSASAIAEAEAMAEPEIEGPAEPEPAATPVDAGPRTVGRYIADALRAAGVRYAFTVPGESFLGLLDGLNEAGIRVIATRHEGGAAFMAEAHAQLTGRPAACLGTRAVGAANLAIGVHTARQNSTPMFVLVGQVAREFKGREAFQEVDQVGTFGRLAKFAAEPASAGEVPGIVEEAVRQALGGRPGPVLLSLA